MMRSDTEQSYVERIQQVLVHIQGHLDDALSLDELAAVACFSPFHFHRIFRGMVGEGVMEHIRRLRLERAAHRLKFSDKSVTRIAFEAGYETHEAFTRAFRAMFDASPSEFREVHSVLPLKQAVSGINYSSDGTVAQFKPIKKGASKMDVRIEEVKPMRVAFVRHVGPYSEAGQAWQKLMQWAGSKGVLFSGPTMLGVVHDDPSITPAARIRYDACLVMSQSFEAVGEIGEQTISGGTYAVTTHRGPYEKLSETYDRFYGEWLPASGREPKAAPGFEIYRNSPYDTLPESLVTDLYMPLAPRQAT